MWPNIWKSSTFREGVRVQFRDQHALGDIPNQELTIPNRLASEWRTVGRGNAIIRWEREGGCWWLMSLERNSPSYPVLTRMGKPNKLS
jgi:hypothetical protein